MKNKVIAVLLVLISIIGSLYIAIRDGLYNPIRYRNTSDIQYLNECILYAPSVILQKLYTDSGSIEISGGQLPVTSILNVSGEYVNLNDAQQKEWLYRIIINDPSLLKYGKKLTILVGPEGILINNMLFFEKETIQQKIQMLDRAFEYYSGYLEVKR